MKKYKRIFSNAAQAVLAYRANFMFEIFSRALGFFVIVYLWKAVYAQSGNIQGFTFNELLTYFLLTELLRNLLEAKTFNEIRDEVRDGKIANYLLLPVKSLYIYFARTLARSVNTFFIFVIPVILLIVFVNFFVGPASLMHFGLAVLMTIIAIFMSLFLFTLFGSVAFWTVETGNIIWAFNFIVMLLAGKLIPVQFLPPIIRNVINLTPFVSLFNLPASIYLGKIHGMDLVFHFCVQGMWLMVLYVVLVFVWNKGLKRLELVGN
ncbi:MAG: ABC transporter permease [Candidatus Gracilibacteria bacterium]